ncbi:hypothetical protein HNP84_005419 [Thermocatellispora tengchongensis]|uniref:DUF4386 domain-containing protein n=1 Tax=Thermocatellispora tengchongensis TaxID=1073253 RepID=A0A840PHY0_9ACTN|nr:DUF4386 domain-containing protein [Thermocatellispora tengchongensis]MBB5135675.1 hypothetical protein [Thermocatellispora tengchongensis]
MNANRRATAIAGALVIAGMIAGGLSVVPAIEEPNFLELVSAHENQVITGALFQFLMIPAYVGFALCLYPALRTASEALSLGFLGFRLIAAAFHFVGVILLPLFLVLSEEYAQAGAAGAPHLEVLGELLRRARDLVNHVALIVSLNLGDLLLFCILYRARFVPRWLSVWGLLGAASAVLASFLVLVRLTDVVTPFYLAMNAPLALQTLVLAIWLIARGFAGVGVKAA